MDDWVEKQTDGQIDKWTDRQTDTRRQHRWRHLVISVNINYHSSMASTLDSFLIKKTFLDSDSDINEAFEG